MKIGLIGYGKMGKEIENVARQRGHAIVARVDIENPIDTLLDSPIDVAIEFTRPESAYENLHFCLSNGIPAISGTTGWLDKKEELDKYCREVKGSYLYSSNYSVGVNIFFELNLKLAAIMNNHPEYGCKLTEIHHVTKLDAPSGTAITLAEGIIKSSEKYERWINGITRTKGQLPIISKRISNAPGTHIIEYDSPIDTITISHEAKSRKGFATGAVLAAEWIVGKTGIFNMKDVLSI